MTAGRLAIDQRVIHIDRVALPTLLLLAAFMRLPDLATRGTWDGDQGHDMLTLRALVQDGVVPLLGPPTSIGDVHHGAWYYYLLSPAAALTGGDSPLAVVALIALAGIAAVGVVWWLARSVGGPVAGVVAGLAMALSAAAIDESTFIWNPNLIALSSAVALAGAWKAWSVGDRRWWLLAAAGTAVTMQCHVLGAALLPVIAVPFVLDARRRRLGAVALGVLAIFVVAYLPLAINELTTGFSEVRAASDYLASGRSGEEVTLPIRFGIVALRVPSWPLTGLIIDGFVAAAVASVALVAIVLWRWRSPADGERFVVRWLGLGLLWSIAFLTIAAPSLASVVRGLPNDHYHAFADPMVFVLVGLGVAALVGEVRAPIGSVTAGVALVALLGWNVTHLPPPVNRDGGFPAADRAAGRVVQAMEGTVDPSLPVSLRSLPDFKSTEALAYPLIRLGRSVHAPMAEGLAPGSIESAVVSDGVVILCDQLFRDAIGADCGGPAEEAYARTHRLGNAPTDRFEAHPGRWISVYTVAGI
ncbi:MAG TPA: glycosyltransferase family 39 protein [Candidatus Limnocylindrales bacterium]